MEAGKNWADGEKTHLFCFSLNPDHRHQNRCNSTIARLERVDADELFVSPLTLQSFTCEFRSPSFSLECICCLFFFLLFLLNPIF
jgi:hypothetical protein